MQPSSSPWLVLVVDDERDQRDLCAQMLVDEGYAVAIAENGEQAIVAAHRLAPAAIVMDNRMPVLDGLSATARLKEHPATQHIPVIVLTGDGEHPTVLRALEAGADAFLGKPCEPRALTTVVARAIRDARQRAITERRRKRDA